MGSQPSLAVDLCDRGPALQERTPPGWRRAGDHPWDGEGAGLCSRVGRAQHRPHRRGAGWVEGIARVVV